MAYEIRTKIFRTSWLALLLLCSAGGCAWVHDLGYRPSDPAGPIQHHNYMPRRSQVCYASPVFHGYHPTCWSPWPEGWEGCPPVTADTRVEVLGEPGVDTPTLAPTESGLQYPAPPLPSESSWQLVPVPQGRGNKAANVSDVLSRDEVGRPLEGDVPSVPTPSPGPDNPFEDEESPAAESELGRVPETSGVIRLEVEGPLTEGPSWRDGDAVSLSSWLVSVTEEPASPDESDWLLSVEDDDLEASTGNAAQ
jgi:hypothetical protein